MDSRNHFMLNKTSEQIDVFVNEQYSVCYDLKNKDVSFFVDCQGIPFLKLFFHPLSDTIDSWV
jgi:hypothetical protein